MARERLEGPADERGPGRPLHPSKAVVRLRQSRVEHLGLGLDATDIDRIADTIERYGERFLRRVFTDGEVAYCTRRKVPAIHFAGRFAAKEAAMKALGTGHSHGVLWRDVEVVRRGGPPQLQLHGGAARRFASMGGVSSLLTITHSDALALAQVMILGR